MSTVANEGTPTPPHLAGEFYVWLWWASERQEGRFDLPEPLGRIELFVDERLAFRNPNDSKISAVMTGENPSTTLESRAALLGGKVLEDLRIRLRRDEREFLVTLKGPEMNIQRAKLPQAVDGGEEGALYDRMFLYEQLTDILGALFRQFTDLRAEGAWESDVLPALRAWVQGMEAGEDA